MPHTKLSLGGNNDVIYKFFPPRESLVSDIPAGDGNIEQLFLRCMGRYFDAIILYKFTLIGKGSSSLI
jgi:hypothetical protein